MQVEVDGLSKVFGDVHAVDNVSFSLASGEVVGLLGPNGAGKSTTIHMVLGLLLPTSGSIRIFGKRLDQHREAILEESNFAAPYLMFPGRLTVRENLTVFAGLYPIRRPQDRIRELLQLFDIEHLADRPVSHLSSGETSRVGLCKAFLNHPRFLLLDEPTAYLDPQGALRVRQTLLDLQSRLGTTILFTSHNMGEVEALCSRVYFLSQGHILAHGTPVEVTNHILGERRETPALQEAFLAVAGPDAMKWRRIKAVVLRHAYEARRNPDRVTDTLYWPLLDVVMWGFFTLYLSKANRLVPGTVSFLLGAILLWNVFRSFQRDLATGFLGELWSRNLVNLFATPLTVNEYLTGLVLVNCLKGAAGLACAGLVAWVCWAYNIFDQLPILLPFLATLLLFGLAVGLVITGLIFRYTTRVQGLAWTAAGFIMPLSCVFYPLSSLPRPLQSLAWGLPTMHAFEGMRHAMADGRVDTLHLAWGLGLSMGWLLLGALFFRTIFDSARACGRLVRVE